ncbi:hypothetical protein AN640_04715 [Candidatus Epulonipiscium fishelsonii]|uniref:Uncharacterized protein n=1 Tax=Candidatus Epulonipiscium fishelsonii TaxID=77094 RepID=A0ACC8XIB0_9FIRM|nr:hypothetical protein AN640_04715 [Epulopiscium sp. SCG-D08WGA-EpuloA1]OON90287.1 MAG: hypothetical protein ATN32_04325 [Epulopiscium sp. AS2M-Bin002]
MITPIDVAAIIIICIISVIFYKVIGNHEMFKDKEKQKKYAEITNFKMNTLQNTELNEKFILKPKNKEEVMQEFKQELRQEITPESTKDIINETSDSDDSDDIYLKNIKITNKGAKISLKTQQNRVKKIILRNKIMIDILIDENANWNKVHFVRQTNSEEWLPIKGDSSLDLYKKVLEKRLEYEQIFEEIIRDLERRKLPDEVIKAREKYDQLEKKWNRIEFQLFEDKVQKIDMSLNILNRYIRLVEIVSTYDFDKMSSEELEMYVERLYKKQGYKTIITQKPRDYGGDIIGDKAGEKLVIQIKKYDNDDVVGVEGIQQIYTATKWHGGNKAILVTNSEFNHLAISLGTKCDVELINRKKLEEMRKSTPLI